MMRKIIDHDDAIDLAADFAAAADALEARQRGGDGCAFDAPGIRGDDRRQAVAYIELAD